MLSTSSAGSSVLPGGSHIATAARSSVTHTLCEPILTSNSAAAKWTASLPYSAPSMNAHAGSSAKAAATVPATGSRSPGNARRITEFTAPGSRDPVEPLVGDPAVRAGRALDLFLPFPQGQCSRHPAVQHRELAGEDQHAERDHHDAADRDDHGEVTLHDGEGIGHALEGEGDQQEGDRQARRVERK